MPAPTTLRRLSTTDLDHIRETLASGRKPKVIFTSAAGQIAGQVGQVVELTDPAVSEEWIVVRFGKDELPFSPDDLAIPPTSAAARRADSTSSVVTVPTPRKAGGAANGPTPAAAANRPISPSTANRQASTASRSATAAPVPVASGTAPARPAAAANGGTPARPAKGSRPKMPPSLTVTLAYTDREWTVAASQGSKTLAKPYVITPTDALRMVSMLDVAGVHEAVENIIAAERAEAEGRAARLRAELAEIESRLSELTGRD